MSIVGQVAGGVSEGVRSVEMILPLETLIADTSNRYELCSACMRRASQLSIAPDEEVDENGNVVSTSVKQILTKKVRYEIGTKTL